MEANAFIVFGLPGTGKTYFSEKLAVDIGAVHLNTDKVRMKYNKEGQYDRETKEFIYEQLKKEMKEHLQEQDDVIIDGTFHKQQRRMEFAECISELAANMFFIEMKAEDQVIRKRMEDERKYSEADYSVYLKIKENFEPFQGEHLTLWSNNQNLNELIRKVKIYI